MADLQTLPEDFTISDNNKLVGNDGKVRSYSTIKSQLKEDLIVSDLVGNATDKALSQLSTKQLVAGVQASLGTAAFQNVGTSARDVIQLDPGGKIPAIDGSQLINLPNETPQGYLFGLSISNNTATPLTNIDISSGITRAADNSQDIILTETLTKNISSPWIVGSGVGGLATSLTLTNGTWYYLFVITNGTIIDAYFDISVDAINKPFGYTKYRRIGSVYYINSNSGIRPFVQTGRVFNWRTKVLEFTSVATSSYSNYIISIPPIPCTAKVYEESLSNGSPDYQSITWIKSKLFDDSTESYSKVAGQTFSEGFSLRDVYSIDSQIQRKSDNQSPNVYNFYTFGYEDLGLGVVDSTGGGSSSSGKVSDWALINYQLPAGTNGGDSGAGAWTTRALNTEIYDTNNKVSLSTSQITIQPGNYIIESWQIFQSDSNQTGSIKTRVRDITNGVTISAGMTERAINPSGTVNSHTVKTPPTYISISVATTYSLQYYTEIGSTSGRGLGQGYSNPGEVEVYASVAIKSADNAPIVLNSQPITYSYLSGTALSISSGNFNLASGVGKATINAMSKLISSTWVVGNGNGGLDTGTVANNKYYYIYAIYNPTSGIGDAIISLNATTPLLPLGYTEYQRLPCAVRTNGSAQILSFTLGNNTLIFSEALNILNNSPQSSPGFTTVLTNALPTLKVAANLQQQFYTTQGGNSNSIVWGNLDNISGSANGGFLITTNNFFAVGGNGYIYADNGSVSWTNSVFAGGVTGSYIWVKSFTDLSTNISTQGNSSTSKLNLPQGYLFGLTLSNNVGTPLTKIDISSGQARDSSNAVDMNLINSLTKSIDSSFATGNNQGGLATSLTLTNGTWYYVFAISNGITTDVYFDTSLTAINKPMGYNYFRRIGSVYYINSTSGIRGFSQFGNKFIYSTPGAIVPSTPNAYFTIDTPPIPCIVTCDNFHEGDDYNAGFWSSATGGNLPNIAFTTQSNPPEKVGRNMTLYSPNGTLYWYYTTGVENNGRLSVLFYEDLTLGVVNSSSQSSITGSNTTNGWTAYPNGKIEQWGITGSIANGSHQTITLPIAFPTAQLASFATLATNSDGPNLTYSLGAENTSASQITVRNYSSAGAIVARWFSIGN